MGQPIFAFGKRRKLHTAHLVIKLYHKCCYTFQSYKTKQKSLKQLVGCLRLRVCEWTGRSGTQWRLGYFIARQINKFFTFQMAQRGGGPHSKRLYKVINGYSKHVLKISTFKMCHFLKKLIFKKLIFPMKVLSVKIHFAVSHTITRQFFIGFTTFFGERSSLQYLQPLFANRILFHENQDLVGMIVGKFR